MKVSKILVDPKGMPHASQEQSSWDAECVWEGPREEVKGRCWGARGKSLKSLKGQSPVDSQHF